MYGNFVQASEQKSHLDFIRRSTAPLTGQLWNVYCEYFGENLACYIYRQVSNIRCTSVGNQIVDHSDVVGAAPTGDAPTTSEWSTSQLASTDWVRTTTRWDEKHLSFEIWCVLYYRLYGNMTTLYKHLYSHIGRTLCNALESWRGYHDDTPWLCGSVWCSESCS